ncbi:unnamed protein product [Ostreobium quekettii]|uniref:Uncharacterized protein n=1 Tax=Ostreobium quekettii TaxID=121088 RepID=A0A8S1JBG3_9CHLO|nr:unnamed protein product [Ostreobium quekettii]
MHGDELVVCGRNFVGLFLCSSQYSLCARPISCFFVESACMDAPWGTSGSKEARFHAHRTCGGRPQHGMATHLSHITNPAPDFDLQPQGQRIVMFDNCNQ